MSATVTYKGATLTTATNQTRTLDTAGTYLEDDITITDVTTIPTGTKNISITANGTTTEDVTSYASASITANVPNSYTASDEGKVVSNGSLVSQTSATYTANDTYDTTTINSVTVDVQGGGGGITGLTYYGTTSVFRQGVYAQPTFPVVADRTVILMCPDEKDGGYVIFFAAYSMDATKYDYGNISQSHRRSNAYKNYAVGEGLTEITPSRYSAFSSWIEDYTITDVPVYLLDQGA